MRSIRRGIREMDIILTRFADLRLDRLSESDLVLYDALLAENDHDLYLWISGQQSPPESYRSLIADIVQSSQTI